MFKENTWELHPMSFQVLKLHHQATYTAPACCSSHGKPEVCNIRGKQEMGGTLNLSTH